MVETWDEKLQRAAAENPNCSDCQRGAEVGTPVTHIHLNTGEGFGYLEAPPRTADALRQH